MNAGVYKGRFNILPELVLRKRVCSLTPGRDVGGCGAKSKRQWLSARVSSTNPGIYAGGYEETKEYRGFSPSNHAGIWAQRTKEPYISDHPNPGLNARVRFSLIREKDWSSSTNPGLNAGLRISLIRDKDRCSSTNPGIHAGDNEDT
jgi:hypothetical protein